LEAEVFLLGHWKDYDELETSLSMSELIATLGAMHEKENRHNKFLAAIQGIDLSDSQQTQDSSLPTLEDVVGRAAARVSGNIEQANAITFGISEDEGLGYSMIGYDL